MHHRLRTLLFALIALCLLVMILNLAKDFPSHQRNDFAQHFQKASQKDLRERQVTTAATSSQHIPFQQNSNKNSNVSSQSISSSSEAPLHQDNSSSFDDIHRPIDGKNIISELFPIEKEIGGDSSSQQRRLLESHHWWVVIGIPSVDTSFGRERRSFQRDSWFHYPNVYSKNVNANTEILVRYLIGLHPVHNYTLSSEILEENEKYQDLIFLNMKEGQPSTGKTSGGAGYWGLEAEVGMSRKAYGWYTLAARKYPNAKFVMKADDDFFLRTMVYSATLKALPSRSLYYGKVMKWGAKKGDPKSIFLFVGGMAVTMSMDLIQWILQSKEAAMFKGEYLENNRAGYKSVNMDHEDVMVARWFFNAKKSHVIAKDCRFHDVHVGANKKPVTSRSVGIHHLKHQLSEYKELMKRFPDKDVPIPEPYEGKSKDPRGNPIYKIC